MSTAVTTSFKPFAVAVQKRWTEMSKGELFVVNAPDLDERYLAAFPAGTDPLFRTKTEPVINLPRRCDVREVPADDRGELPPPPPRPRRDRQFH